jgi:hypothetical protein
MQMKQIKTRKWYLEYQSLLVSSSHRQFDLVVKHPIIARLPFVCFFEGRGWSCNQLNAIEIVILAWLAHAFIQSICFESSESNRRFEPIASRDDPKQKTERYGE